jgi:hypothetical protein
MDKVKPHGKLSLINFDRPGGILVEFRVRSICRYCGQEFTAIKRYNDFIGIWEIDSESCEECNNKIRLKILLPQC